MTKCAMPANAADAGITVSLFIDADAEQIKAAADVGAPYIEIHTGCYADAKTMPSRLKSWSVSRKRLLTPRARVEEG